MQKAISIFTNSAGALLLALASALFLINWTSPIDLVPPHDPIFLLSIRDLFWIVGGIALVMALICFFSEQPLLPIFLLAWLAVNYFAYRISLFSNGCHSLTGFLGGFTYAFGLPVKMANVTMDVVFVYLLGGSLAALWIVRRLPPPTQSERMSCPSCGTHIQFIPDRLSQKIPCPQCQTIITLCHPPPVAMVLGRVERSQPAVFVRTLKISCTACGGHIEFSTNFFGGKIPCPHCRTTITLQKTRNLKMACAACGGHIEFPDHALGRKIPCPHCQTDINLKEPA